MFKDTLWDLLNCGMFDPEGEVNNALIGGIASVLDKQYQDGIALVNNLSPITADSNGIAVWEQILGLPTDPTLSLQTRQQQCLAKANRLTGAITKTQLTNLLNSFSASKSALVIESPSTYQVYGQLPMDEATGYQAILRAVKLVLPAHLQYIPMYLITVQENLNELVSRTTQLISNRLVYANNGGLSNTGLFLDNSWNLDGSHLLSNKISPYFGATLVDSLIVSLLVNFSRNRNLEGYVLNGGLHLDGAWNMSGQYIADDPFGHAMNLTMTRPIQTKAVTNESSTITVNRTSYAQNGGPLNNSVFMDGSWNLDGGKALKKVFTTDFAKANFRRGVFSRTIDFRQQSDMTGIILDGHRKLDNSWNLVGTTLIPDPIGKVVTMNGTKL